MVAHTSRIRLWVASILVIALLLRVCGSGFGQGALTARPDEEVLRTGAWHALSGDLNPHYAVWGHLFHWIYVAAGAIVLEVQILGGHVKDWWDGMALALEDGSVHFLLGRWLSALFGTFNVLAVYVLAHRATRNRVVAGAAATILCFAFLHVRDSHFATCDILLTLLCTCTLAASLGGGPGGAGVLAGLAMAAKLSALPAVAAAGLVILWNSLLSERRRWLRSTVRYGLVAILTWAVIQPFLWIDLPQTRYGLFRDLFNPERQPLRSGLHLENLSIICRYYVPHAIGWPAGLLALIGSGYLLWKRPFRAGTVALFAYVALNLAALVTVERMFLRYLDPALPAIAVLTSVGCFAVAHCFCAITGSCWGRTGVMLLLVLIASADGAWRSLQLIRLLRTEDTRQLALDWLNARAEQEGRPLDVVWCGFGEIAAHLTAPWGWPAAAYREAFLVSWEKEGERAELLRAIRERWRAEGRPEVNIVAWDRGQGADCRPVPAWQAYRGPVIHADLSGLVERWDEWWRHAGVLRRFQPRLFVCRAFLTGRVVCDRDPDPRRDEPADYVVMTFMPWDRDAKERALLMQKRMKRVAVFEPAEGDDIAGCYDLGDAWWVPGRDMHKVTRPGPYIWIFATQ